MLKFPEDRNVSYGNISKHLHLGTTLYIHVSYYHNVPHKYMQVLYVKKVKVGKMRENELCKIVIKNFG